MGLPRGWWCVAASCLVPLLAGCGQGLGTVPITGKVFYQGQPLGDGDVLYAPVDPNGRLARAQLKPDGTFTLSTNAELGAMPGEYKVVILAYAPHPGEPGRGDTPADAAPPMIVRDFIIPKKYTTPEETPFQDTVDADHPGYKEWKIE